MRGITKASIKKLLYDVVVGIMVTGAYYLLTLLWELLMSLLGM